MAALALGERERVGHLHDSRVGREGRLEHERPGHVAVLAAELARGAIRISLGATTTETDIDRLLQVWQKLAQSLSIGEKRGQDSSRFAA